MSYEYSEDGLIENATQDVLKDLGWTVKTAWTKETFGSDGLLGRENKGEVILKRDLLAALKKLNKGLPDLVYQQAIEIIVQKSADKSLAKINKEKYELFKDGVPVSYTGKNGKLEKKKLKVFDFDNYTNNEFLAVRQLEVLGDLYNRRPDVVGFVNGIPLVFFELKAHHTDLRNAYTDNITDYKDTIPHVFHCNAFVVLSNGTDAKVGTITSPYKFFLEWKRIVEEEEGVVDLDTMLRGTCSKENLMDIFENFLLFDESGGDIVKIMAKNHQFIGVNKVINKTNDIEELKGKLGVFWHTQGSGKSYSIVFICQKIHRKFGGAYTFLIVVDRSELERQIYDTFSGIGAVKSKEVIAGSKQNISGREHLRELLSENHRYVFTLIHKFSFDPKKESEYPLLTNRKNIIVISDEAHRTQNGIFARNMRFNAIPNASYLGFTGTPIIKEEKEITVNIFGEYVSIYDFQRAVDDGATLPLKYLNKGERLKIQNPKINKQMAKVIQNEDLDADQKRKLASLFKTDYVVLTSQKRLDAIAKDLVWDFNERGYQGKAMFVTLDKPTAVKMYDLIMKYWPQYVAELKLKIKKVTDQQEENNLIRKLKKVEETEVSVIVSSEQNEVDTFRKMKLNIEQHRRKMVTRDMEKEFKDEENPFRLVILCAMWITGFDAPCVSTVYLDKPIEGHTLMQTIARANRIYNDEKENGLIVDYGNVYTALEEAYSVYGKAQPKGRGKKGEKNGASKKKKPFGLLVQLAEELKKSIDDVSVYLKQLGFNLNTLANKDAKPMEKIASIKKAVNCISLNQKTRAKFEIMAREVFKKYMSLYPEEQIKPFLRQYNAIEAIYQQLNQQTKTADITEVVMELQDIVNESVTILTKKNQPDVWVDLSNLDFEKLKAAFAKTERKNTLVFDLQKVIAKKLERMMRDNPLRLEFYERYQEIIKEYNNGKTLKNTMEIFNKLEAFIKSLNEEDSRAVKENLDEQSLAVFDLLRNGKKLSKKEIEDVKKVSVDVLDKLKKEKLKIERWRESIEVTSQVKIIISNTLQYLPQNTYTDIEVDEKSNQVYQHIYSYYNVTNSMKAA